MRALRLASSSSQVANIIQFNTIRRPTKQYGTPLERRSGFSLLFPILISLQLKTLVLIVLLEIFEDYVILLKGRFFLHKVDFSKSFEFQFPLRPNLGFW